LSLPPPRCEETPRSEERNRRQSWSDGTSLDHLPPARRRRRYNDPPADGDDGDDDDDKSDDEANDEPDDDDKSDGESDRESDDEANNESDDDDLSALEPDDEADDYNDGDIAHYDSDGHYIHDKYDEDDDDEDDEADEQSASDNDEDSDDDSEDPFIHLISDPQYLVWRELPENRQQEFIRRREWYNLTSDYLPLRRTNNQRRTDDDDDDTDDGVYSDSTVSFHPDDESIDSFDSLFRRADFPRIIADLEVIRQNGRIRTEDGTYIDIEEPETFVFTERDIRANIRNYPDSFLRRYFQEPWPNLH